MWEVSLLGSGVTETELKLPRTGHAPLSFLDCFSRDAVFLYARYIDRFVLPRETALGFETQTE